MTEISLFHVISQTPCLRRKKLLLFCILSICRSTIKNARRNENKSRWNSENFLLLRRRRRLSPSSPLNNFIFRVCRTVKFENSQCARYYSFCSWIIYIFLFCFGCFVYVAASKFSMKFFLSSAEAVVVCQWNAKQLHRTRVAEQNMIEHRKRWKFKNFNFSCVR